MSFSGGGSATSPGWLRRLSWLGKLSFSLVLLGIVFAWIEPADVLQQVRRLSPAWFIAAFVLLVLQLVLNALRWQLIASAISARLSFKSALQLYEAGLFVNLFLPGTVGGDGFRVWAATRAGLSLSDAANSVLLERCISVLGLLLMAAAVLPWLDSRIGPAATLGIGLVTGAGLGATLVLIVLGGWWTRRVTAPRWRWTVALGASLRRMLLSPAPAATQLVLAVTAHALTMLAIYAVAQSLGAALYPLHALILLPTLLLAVLMPISLAGWGLREGAMVVLLGTVGIAGETAVLVSVSVGLLMMIVSLPGSFFVLGAPLSLTMPDRDNDL